MKDDHDKVLRTQLVQGLRGDQSHIDFESAINHFPVELAGVKLAGAPHTAWQLLEHMRLALHDILEFSRDPKHESPAWPDGYWPTTEAPASVQEWDASVAAFKEHSLAMEDLITDSSHDLFKPIEGGSGQTLLREALVAAAHNSYHLGQLVFLKKALLAK